jgi:hypothetical protein
MEKLEIMKTLLETNIKIIEMEKKVEKIKVDTENFYERHNIAITDLLINTFIDIQLAKDGISGWERDTRDFKHKPYLLTIFDMMLECEMPVDRLGKVCLPIDEETINMTDMNKFNWEEYEKYEADNQYDYISSILLHMLNIDKLYSGSLFREVLKKVDRYFYSVYKVERKNIFDGGYDIVKEQLKILKDFKKELTLE